MAAGKRPHAEVDGGEEAAFLRSIPIEHSISIRLLESQLGVQSRVPIRLVVIQSDLPTDVKQTILRKMHRGCDPKFEQWIQRAIELPIGIYTSNASTSSIGDLLHAGKAEMDRYICGNGEAKMEILRLLGQWATAPSATTPQPIGLEGPPGVGKTTFARAALANTLKRPFCCISLGGASDGSLIFGHSYTCETRLATKM